MTIRASNQRFQLWSIQYLRALAAISVIVFHLLQTIPLMWVGEHGVDLFFVISGFMMTIMTTARATMPRAFIVDRLSRIVPLYWIATLAALLFSWAFVKIFGVSYRLDLLLKSIVFIPAYNDQGHIWPSLYLGWTLNYEMFFYAIFACCLLIPAKFRLSALTALLLTSCCIGAATGSASPILLTWTNPIILEFCAGTWLGAIAGPRNDRFGAASAVCLMLLPGLGLVFASLFSGRLLFGGVAALLIVAGLALERHHLLPRSFIVKRLGDASYSIYLFQALAFAAVDGFLTMLSDATGYRWTMVRYSVPLSIACALCLGYAIFYCVERPGTRWVRRQIG